MSSKERPSKGIYKSSSQHESINPATLLSSHVKTTKICNKEIVFLQETQVSQNLLKYAGSIGK